MIDVKLSKREATIFVVCITTFIAYVMVQFVIKPLIEKTGSLDQQITLSERKFKKNLKVIAKEGAVDQELKQYLSIYDQKFSDEQEVSTMIKEIESVAKRMDINISKMTPKRTMKKDFYKRFPVSLTLDGQWLSVLNFMHLLQDEPYYFDIDEIQIEQGRGQSKTRRGQLSLSRLRILPPE